MYEEKRAHARIHDSVLACNESELNWIETVHFHENVSHYTKQFSAQCFKWNKSEEAAQNMFLISWTSKHVALAFRLFSTIHFDWCCQFEVHLLLLYLFVLLQHYCFFFGRTAITRTQYCFSWIVFLILYFSFSGKCSISTFACVSLRSRKLLERTFARTQCVCALCIFILFNKTKQIFIDRIKCNVW